MPPKISRREKIKRKRLERRLKKKHRPRVESKKSSVARRRVGRRRKASPQLKHSEEVSAADKDDHDINQMRKLLKLKKKKGLPLSFKQDGLDYLLDVAGNGEEDWGASSDEETQSTKKPKKNCFAAPSKRKVRFDVAEEEEESEESDSDLDMFNYDNTDEIMDEETFEESKDDSEDESEENEVEPDATAKYVLPQKREISQKLRKQVQGLINRLSESNLHNIHAQIELLYQSNSSHDMNSVMSETLMKATVRPVVITTRFALDHVMVVALLHSTVGTEVGCIVVQCLVKRLDSLLKDSPNYGDGKECDCVVLMLSHLYNFLIVHCNLIYDIIRRLIESFTERDIELILVLLTNCGMQIRRDDPKSLKDIIRLIQAKSSEKEELTQSSRVKFMFEVLSAIRTNNVRKIPNYDHDMLEHKRKLLRGMCSKALTDAGQMNISLNDLLNADTQGRWWVVGSAWKGRELTDVMQKPVMEEKEGIMEIARQQRMNTDIRRTIFCVVMTSEDYLDAFEKLMGLKLSDMQERNIIYIVMDCCLQEKDYNPYYAYLAQRLCEYKRDHQITMQYVVWDNLRRITSMSSIQVRNFTHSLVHLITTKAISINVLRVTEFTRLTNKETSFYKAVLTSIVCHPSEPTARTVLSILPSSSPEFRNGLLVFAEHYLKSEISARYHIFREAIDTVH